MATVLTVEVSDINNTYFRWERQCLAYPRNMNGVVGVEEQMQINGKNIVSKIK